MPCCAEYPRGSACSHSQGHAFRRCKCAATNFLAFTAVVVLPDVTEPVVAAAATTAVASGGGGGCGGVAAAVVAVVLVVLVVVATLLLHASTLLQTGKHNRANTPSHYHGTRPITFALAERQHQHYSASTSTTGSSRSPQQSSPAKGRADATKHYQA